MKKILILIFSMALCVTLAACNNNQAVNIDDNSKNSPLPASATETDTLAEPNKPVDNLDDMYNAYFTVLENLIQNHILPDGIDGGEQLCDMAENKFAVYDVDSDGKEELLLMYTTTYSGGWAGYVLDYDAETKKLQTELCEFTLLTFYDNGIIKAGWSHNQGLAGDFWPYSLYQYAPDSDSYVLVGMVDAWDKNYPGTDNQNNPFPSDIDKSGTGFVYYIMKDGRYDNTHPVDASEYNEWVNAHIGDASEIQIQYMDLTEENISKIGNGS
ncbi:hypothetical protein [Geosporobacter ferrireducens]|uniref:hypothetical protein n=1 Tax=Geosporobacter ferrireducens TaxID=1424294 RepID=UPI00139DCEDE|nr:hypothetical protein [Geosporobacter ferrireducens]MTI55651.1 hypothetical protein [Geosporobacter ferrireducens]